MTDIALDANNDLDFTGRQLTLLGDGPSIAQEIRIAMRFFLGEWALDTRVGIDFFGRILGVKGITPDEVSNEFRKAILSIPGVTQIDSIATTIDTATRVGTVTWRVVTDSSTVVEGAEALVLV